MAAARTFLDRRSYRTRRMMDALRILPVIGLMLWMLPLFWPVGDEAAEPIKGSSAIIYIFVVWCLLIGAALGLSLRLRPFWLTPAEPAAGAKEQPGDGVK